MASVNKVILVGHLGRDPELRTFPDGGRICNVSIATSFRWKDKASGEQQEHTEWHRLVFRDRLAEIADEYLVKGSLIYVEGTLRTRQYDKDGQTHYTTEIVVLQMQMLNRPDADKQRPAPAQQRPGGNSYADAKSGRAPAPKTGTGFDDMDDDIPF